MIRIHVRIVSDIYPHGSIFIPAQYVGIGAQYVRIEGAKSAQYVRIGAQYVRIGIPNPLIFIIFSP